MTEYWFKPKTYGYGATPSNWKGWTATLGFIAVSLLITLPFIVLPVLSGHQPSAAGLVSYFVLLGLGVLGFVRLCRAKTDGIWRWRWGDDQ